MAENRFIGDYPVIGIRPIIDTRREPLGVRHSLEEQTMGMAKAAAKLFTENLKYSNGDPVKVVISDTSIGQIAESAACADQFKKEGVDITLSVTPCWCYGSETMDIDPNTIKGVWGFNVTERPGAVYLASVLAAHAQKGLPAFGIYDKEVQKADDTSISCTIKEKLLSFAEAAIVVDLMRKGNSYLQVDDTCKDITYLSNMLCPNKEFLEIGTELVDEVEIFEKMEETIYDEVVLGGSSLKYTINNSIDDNHSLPEYDKRAKNIFELKNNIKYGIEEMSSLAYYINFNPVSCSDFYQKNVPKSSCMIDYGLLRADFEDIVRACCIYKHVRDNSEKIDIKEYGKCIVFQYEDVKIIAQLTVYDNLLQINMV